MPRRKPKQTKDQKIIEIVTQDVQSEFAPDEEIRDDDNLLAQRIEENTAMTPSLSAGDVDAQWDRADIGEEAVGGSTPTPDQDIVDELGEAVGISYQDTEPLQTEDKLVERDHERWELDIRSRDDAELARLEELLDEE